MAHNFLKKDNTVSKHHPNTSYNLVTENWLIMKKRLLGLGTIGMIVLPLASVVSCGNSSTKNSIKLNNLLLSKEIKPTIENISNIPLKGVFMYEDKQNKNVYVGTTDDGLKKINDQKTGLVNVDGQNTGYGFMYQTQDKKYILALRIKD